METRHIGSLEVTVIGLGTNNFGAFIDEAGAKEVVAAAVDAGINFFDTADVYGSGASEVALGRALGSRRDDVLIATKFGMPLGEGNPHVTPEDVRSSCDASLQRLGTDHIDLYYQHIADPTVPIEDTLGALDELIKAGKVREIACSNFPAGLIDEATKLAASQGTARFVAVENELSLLRRESTGDHASRLDAGPPARGAELIAVAERNDMAVLPYLPLASGLLTGKYRRGVEPAAGTRLGSVPEERRAQMFKAYKDWALSDKNFDIIEALEAFATERGHTLVELAMSWLACLPKVATVIAGATSPAQVRTNADAAGWVLTDADMAEVDRITLL
jgi:aryl-alcohol dehydrogenase-like predicted oxidoreductase